MRQPRLSLRPRMLAGSILAIAVVVAGVPGVAADEDTLQELERRLHELERQLAELEAREAEVDPARIEEIERQIQVLAVEIEDLKLGEAATGVSEGKYGLGPAASRVYGVDRGVSIGGYGEMLYENFDPAREDGLPSGRTDRLDFLRAVLYFGYKFNERILFNSELEVEHATTGEGAEERGEVSLEFAYLDFLVREAFSVRAGLLLVPMGFINELHEPPIFLGARRPFVEQRLVPTTWRENGAGIHGASGPVSYRVYVVNGLAAVEGTSSEAEGFSAEGIRDGRSSGSSAAAEDLALIGRLDWRPAPWLTLGGSAYIGDAGQGRTTPTGRRIGARTTLQEVHAELRRRGVQARTLYVRTDIDDVELINEAQGFTGSDSVGEEQYGWYAEVGYNVLAAAGDGGPAVTPYLRYERFDTQDRVPAGFSADPANDVTVTTLGVSWKPILNVAIKADYNRIRNDARTGTDQFNVAVGFLY